MFESHELATNNLTDVSSDIQKQTAVSASAPSNPTPKQSSSAPTKASTAPNPSEQKKRATLKAKAAAKKRRDDEGIFHTVMHVHGGYCCCDIESLPIDGAL